MTSMCVIVLRCFCNTSNMLLKVSWEKGEAKPFYLSIKLNSLNNVREMDKGFKRPRHVLRLLNVHVCDLNTTSLHLPLYRPTIYHSLGSLN